jgi:predicted phage terminase large subunit-like protein
MARPTMPPAIDHLCSVRRPASRLLARPVPFGVASPPLSISERLDVIRFEESFGDFTATAWHHAGEPQIFQSNWHIDCIADYLMAVARREIKGPGPLIFTMPPRHMKSRGVNVFFPAWVWAQDPDPPPVANHGFHVRPNTLMGPGVKFAFITYKQDLSNDHSDACRRLLHSDWYQERWGHRCVIDRDATQHFSNTAGGDRRALSFSGITGFGADIIVVDDAHDIESVDSDVVREHALRLWDEVLQSRLNDPNTGIFIIIMQRSHERDLIGHILSKEFNGMHVCLPAEHERNHPYVFAKAKPGWEVPRLSDSSHGTDGGPKRNENWYDFRQEGEALWKNRFSVEKLRQLQSGMTSHVAAGQYQQRPTAREGGLFKRAWFDNKVRVLPEASLEHMVRAWDLAATEAGGYNDPDYTVGLLMARDPNTSIIYIADVIRGRWSPAKLWSQIETAALVDGTTVKIRIPQDPGNAGKFQAHHFATQLQGYRIDIEREQGDKEYRADPFAAQCEIGNVRLVEGPWNDRFIEELCAFPNGAHDDQVDAVSAAFRTLVKRRGGAVAVGVETFGPGRKP